MRSSNDILILGGGIIGLAIALELRLQGATVCILNRNFNEAASYAAAGMLAPQAEAIALESPLFKLCLQSRELYPEWIQKLEALTHASSGYWPCGVLMPAYTMDSAKPTYEASAANSQASARWPCPAQWFDSDQLQQLQPGLSPELIGGWWLPKEGQVDNRALMHCLLAANRTLGIEIDEGVEVRSLQCQAQQVVCVETSAGSYRAEHYVLASGAWSQELLSIPVYPRKGQMLAVQAPFQINTEQNLLPLKTILYGDDVYLIPRQTGRILIGATNETVGFTPHNTPAGIQGLLTAAIHLYPGLKHYPLTELWWGFRPTTPDELPILGPGPYRNLTLATGHYRNGILLAPITGLLIANSVLRAESSPLLSHFHYSRFQS